MRLFKVLFATFIFFASVYNANGQISSENLVGIHNLNSTQISGLVSPIKGSLVFNTDSNRLFVFDGTIWVATATVDTTSLSNRINLRVRYADTASMLSPYLRSALGVKYTDTAYMLVNYINSASNGLNQSGKDVRLGGNLTAATTITNNANALTIATGGSALNVTGLTAGAATDSLLTINTATGRVNRVAPSLLNKVDSTTASNGITLTGKDVRLGGNLTAATTITNNANTLTIATGGSALNVTGLTAGAATDSLLTINIATGRVNRVAPSLLNKVDSTTASNGITLTGKDVRLGGNLTAATTITNNANTLTIATGGSALNVTGLTAGAATDSLLTINTATGRVNRVAPSLLNKADSTTASNGITLSGKDVRLGGNLSSATSITTTGVNTLSIAGLQGGTTNDSVLVADASTGTLKRVSPTRLNTIDSTTASNGITMTGKDLRLGGNLSAATSITTTGVNTLALAGLQSGTTNDSLVVADASSGILKRVSSSRFANGWSLTGNAGTVAGTNFIGTTDGIDLVFKVNSVESGRLNLYNLSTSYGYSSIAAYKSTAIGYAASTGSNTESVTIGNASSSVYRSVSVGSEAVSTGNNSIALGQAATAAFQGTALGSTASATGNNSTAIGFGATTTQANALILGNSSAQVGIGTSTPGYALDVNATSNPLKLSGLVSGTLNDSLMTINSSTGVVRRIAPTQLNKADSTTASNGITLTGKDVRLGGNLTAATTITNNANTLTIATGGSALNVTGLTAGAATDSLLTINTTTGRINRVAPSLVNKADSTTASNGITLTGKDVRLGGSLTGATTITTTGTNTLALAGLTSGDFTTDSFLVINGSTNVVKRVSNILPQILVVANRTSSYSVTSSYNTLIYNSAPVNVGSSFNTTTGIFTAPATGLYQVLVHNTYQTSSATNNYIKNRIIADGSTDLEVTLAITPYSGTTVSTLSANSIVSLTSGDTIYITQGGEVGTMDPTTGSGVHTLKIIRIK